MHHCLASHCPSHSTPQAFLKCCTHTSSPQAKYLEPMGKSDSFAIYSDAPVLFTPRPGTSATHRLPESQQGLAGQALRETTADSIRLKNHVQHRAAGKGACASPPSSVALNQYRSDWPGTPGTIRFSSTSEPSMRTSDTAASPPASSSPAQRPFGLAGSHRNASTHSPPSADPLRQVQGARVGKLGKGVSRATQSVHGSPISRAGKPQDLHRDLRCLNMTTQRSDDGSGTGLTRSTRQIHPRDHTASGRLGAAGSHTEALPGASEQAEYRVQRTVQPPSKASQPLPVQDLKALGCKQAQSAAGLSRRKLGLAQTKLEDLKASYRECLNQGGTGQAMLEQIQQCERNIASLTLQMNQETQKSFPQHNKTGSHDKSNLANRKRDGRSGSD